jgi:hypothetical protein
LFRKSIFFDLAKYSYLDLLGVDISLQLFATFSLLLICDPRATTTLCPALSTELERLEDPVGLGWCLANFNIFTWKNEQVHEQTRGTRVHQEPCLGMLGIPKHMQQPSQVDQVQEEEEGYKNWNFLRGQND